MRDRRGKLRRVEAAGLLRFNTRPVHVDAAAQVLFNSAADVKNWSGHRTHSHLGVRGPTCERRTGQDVPTSEFSLGGAVLDPLTDFTQREGACPSWVDRRESSAQSLPVRSPGWLLGERSSILCSLSRIRGTGILQISRQETLEKPETEFSITSYPHRWQRFWAIARKSLPAMCPRRARVGPGTNPKAYFRHNPRMWTRRNPELAPLHERWTLLAATGQKNPQCLTNG